MFTTVMEWQRTLLYRDGKLEKVLEPGRHRYDQRRCTLVAVDMRPRQLQVSGQELLTRDGLSLRVSFAVNWVVTDPLAFTTARSTRSRYCTRRSRRPRGTRSPRTPWTNWSPTAVCWRGPTRWPPRSPTSASGCRACAPAT